MVKRFGVLVLVSGCALVADLEPDRPLKECLSQGIRCGAAHCTLDTVCCQQISPDHGPTASCVSPDEACAGEITRCDP